MQHPPNPPNPHNPPQHPLDPLTAFRVVCNWKQSFGDQCTLGFAADTQRQEWAKYTPFLDLRVTVTARTAELFTPGERYALFAHHLTDDTTHTEDS